MKGIAELSAAGWSELICRCVSPENILGYGYCYANCHQEKDHIFLDISHTHSEINSFQMSSWMSSRHVKEFCACLKCIAEQKKNHCNGCYIALLILKTCWNRILSREIRKTLRITHWPSRAFHIKAQRVNKRLLVEKQFVHWLLTDRFHGLRDAAPAHSRAAHKKILFAKMRENSWKQIKV